MAFEHLKARLGVGGRRRQFVDIESVRDLEDISDPETTEDESHTTLRERARDHPVLAIVVSVVGVIVAGLLLFYMSSFAPHVFTNPWVHRGVAAGAIGLYCYRRGWRAHRSNVADYDELVLKMEEKATTYKGVYLDDLPGKADGFIPIKGWHKAGHEAVPYKNADLGAAMVEAYNPYQMTDDAAAVIRLQPTDDLAVTDTEHGKRVVQRTGGLKPDGDGNHTSLMATLPNYDDKRASELAKQVETLTSENNDLRGELQAHVRRIQNIKDRMNEPIEEEVSRRLQQSVGFAHAMQSSSRGRARNGDSEDWVGTGTIEAPPGRSQAEQELQDVEEEVTPDDED